MKEEKRTPKFANFLLRQFCRNEYLEEVTGDLEENYQWRVEKEGRARARYRYYLDVLSAIRLISMASLGGNALSGSMLLSFTKSSLRNFNRNKAYTFLNIFGLALGMASALFILEYASDELGYDGFSQSDQMYRIGQDFVKNNELLYKTAVAGAPVAPALLSDLPKVEKSARLLDYTRIWTGKNVFMVPDQPEKRFVEPDVYFADPAILELFDLDLIVGSARLDEPNTVLLSADMAIKYFGSADKAIGQSIQHTNVSGKPKLLVRGVYDLPTFNMQVRPAALISFSTLIDKFGEVGPHQMWGVNSSLTYVKLVKGASLAQFQNDLANVLLKYNPIESAEARNGFRIGSLKAMPIRDIHLQSTYQDEVGAVGNATTVKMLLMIAVLIVIIAWVNYINLATAHSLNRLKELGVRKVMGARKLEIVAQFFVEAFFMNVFALVLAVAMVMAGQQFFNYQIDKHINLEAIDWLRFGWSAGLIFLSGVLLSGLYPLSVFFSLNTVTVLKGQSKKVVGSGLRKGMIVFQFLAGALLIMATVAINRQLNYMNQKDLGMDVNSVLVLDGPTVKSKDKTQNQQKTALLIDQIKALSNVRYAGVSNSIQGKPILQSQSISTQANDQSTAGQFELVVGDQYLNILEVQFLAGGNFTINTNTNSGEVPIGDPQIILSESASKVLGFERPMDAIGRQVYRWYNGGVTKPALVVGVVEDYHHEALSNGIDPMVFYQGNSWDNHYLVKLESPPSVGLMAEIEAIYQSVFPENPLNYYFLDDYFGRQYRSEEVNGKVFASFSTIAILVACLGLFGLSSFIALQRTKEIGIRKVLGAGVKTVFVLLSKELILLAGLGFLLAAPLGYYGISRWLEGFAYHIAITPSMFWLPLLIVILLATLAISPRVLKTAFMNPIQSLRHE